MTNLVIALAALLVAAAIAVIFLASERKSLKHTIDQSRADRADRAAAYARNAEAHAQHIKDVEASTARLRDLTDQIRRLSSTISKEN